MAVVERLGRRPVYAPRDPADIGVVLDLVRSALAFARGDSVRSRSE